MAQFDCRGGTPATVDMQRVAEKLRERRLHVGREPADVGNHAVEYAQQDTVGGLSIERVPPGDGLEQHQRQGPQVY